MVQTKKRGLERFFKKVHLVLSHDCVVVGSNSGPTNVGNNIGLAKEVPRGLSVNNHLLGI